MERVSSMAGFGPGLPKKGYSIPRYGLVAPISLHTASASFVLRLKTASTYKRRRAQPAKRSRKWQTKHCM